MQTETKLKQARTAKGISQIQLAALAGLSPTTLNRLELWDFPPRRDTALKIAAALGVSVETLWPVATTMTAPPDYKAMAATLPPTATPTKFKRATNLVPTKPAKKN